MQTWTAPRPAPPAAAGPAAPAFFYVPVPRRLAEDLRDSPAALGVFALLARAFRAAAQPVPLSPADLRAFDPALSYGAATRALQRLCAAGWLIPTRHPGRKTAYAPSWGRVGGAPLPWDLAAPALGRPRHLAALRLDQRLLDVCMGRLAPHPTHPASVGRYLVAPLLGLREVGAYALALAGLPAASPPSSSSACSPPASRCPSPTRPPSSPSPPSAPPPPPPSARRAGAARPSPPPPPQRPPPARRSSLCRPARSAP